MIASALSLVAQAQARGGNWTFLVSLVLMFAVFYFLLIRPQQRRARQQRELIESLGPGDEVITIGGMFGTITRIDDESVTLDVGPGHVRFLKQAIARKFVPADGGSQAEPEGEGAGEGR